MKKYYKIFRRKSNIIFFAVFGGLVFGLGAAGIFWASTRILAAVCLAVGAVLLTYPMVVLCSRVSIRDGFLRYRNKGIAHKTPLSEIGAVVLCVYDEYRRGKGFVKASVSAAEGQQVFVPCIVFVRLANEDELDVCATRTNAGFTFRDRKITEAVLDFDFLQELYDSQFGGTVYVYDYVAEMFQPALERIFGSDPRVVRFDDVPKKLKNLQK